MVSRRRYHIYLKILPFKISSTHIYPVTLTLPHFLRLPITDLPLYYLLRYTIIDLVMSLRKEDFEKV